jgi:GxxExxY protein
VKHEKLTGIIIKSAIEVHRVLGPGLLESAYEQCMAYELTQEGVHFKLQHGLAVEYKGIKLDCGYRIDLLIEDKLIKGVFFNILCGSP